MARPERRGRYTPPKRKAEPDPRDAAAGELQRQLGAGMPPGWQRPPGWDARLRKVAHELYGYCLVHDEWVGDVGEGRQLRARIDRGTGLLVTEWVRAPA